MDENGNGLNTCAGDFDYTIPFVETLFYPNNSGSLDNGLDAEETLISTGIWESYTQQFKFNEFNGGNN